jgi:acyl-CoA synthetase (AMP-forming)/AMP-acid ligase II
MNLAMLLELAAEGLGDRTAVGSISSGLTYERLRRMAAAAGAELSASGAATFAFLDANGPAVPVGLFGSAWAGVSYAPLNYRLPDHALLPLVERLGKAAAVGGAEHLAPLAGTDLRSVTETAAWLERLRDDGEPAGDYVGEPDRPAILLFTSGTSAAPKAAVLHHDNLLSYVLNTVEFASADEDEATILAVPPFHIAGVAGVLSSVYAGRRIVPMARFVPEAWLATARDERITHAFLVPTMIARLVSAMDHDPDLRVPSLRSLAYGGARMPVPVLERALELFPNAGFVNAYGLTETSSTVALLGPDDHRAAMSSPDPAVRARLGSVGRPLPSVEVEVIGEDGEAVAAGEVGRLRIRGPQVAGTYLDDPDAVDGSGWLLTGDLGSVDADGYLFVHGRADDVIIRGGENISPGEIEDMLLRHPDITGAAVVGVPDIEWGERVAAMITCRRGADVDVAAVAHWLHEEIGTLKTPEIMRVSAELPMTPTGKVLRRVVRQQLAEQPGSAG